MEEASSSSSMPSEPTERSNPAPGIEEAGYAFETSELTDEDIEALKQQGLSPVGQSEDGYTVFIYDRSIFEATNASEEEEDEDEDEEEEEEEEEESSSAFRGRITPSENHWHHGYATGTSKLRGREFIRCNLQVQTACDVSDPEQVKHAMKLDYLKLELPDSVNDEKRRGHFVYCIIVEVTPTEEWRTKIHGMYAMPSDDSQPDEYTDQRTRGMSGVVALSAPWSAGIQFSPNSSTGVGVTSKGEYKWASAKVDVSPERQRWSVTWKCNLVRWKDGQPFDADKPWKVRGWTLPEVTGLPTLSLVNVEHNWAEWSTSSSLKGTEKMEWDVAVNFRTVSLKRLTLKLSTLATNGYEYVTIGPEQIASIKKRISGMAVSSVSVPLL